MRSSNKSINLKLPSIEAHSACYALIGTGPMLVHAFGQKSFTEMLEKMVGCRQDGTPLDSEREPKDLEREFVDAHAFNERGEEVIPCRWIKAGMLTAVAASRKQLNASAMRRAVRVTGFTSPILDPKGRKAATAELQHDVVRVGSWSNRTPDVRARPRYDEWMIEIVVKVIVDQVPMEHVAWALSAMGELVGLGDWRTEKNGEYGFFKIKGLHVNETDRIMKACSSPERRLVIPPALMTAMKTKGITQAQVHEEMERIKGGGKNKSKSRSNGAQSHGEVS
jgi:hypothetical protein